MLKKYLRVFPVLFFVMALVILSNILSVKAAPPPIAYTVIFDSQGGTEIPRQVRYFSDMAEGEVFKAEKPDDPIKEGYTFIGWYHYDWHTGEYYSLTEWDFDDVVTIYDFYLRAKWTPTPYTLTVTGGTGSGDYTVEDTVTVTANPAPNGQRFKEWDISAEVEYTEGNSATETISFVMPAGDITLMAIYEDIPSTTETTTNTVTTAVPTTTTANKTAANTISTPPKTGDNSSVSALIVVCVLSMTSVFVVGKKHKSEKP